MVAKSPTPFILILGTRWSDWSPTFRSWFIFWEWDPYVRRM